MAFHCRNETLYSRNLEKMTFLLRNLAENTALTVETDFGLHFSLDVMKQ